MNMFEEAQAISGMLTMKNMTQTEIAKLLGTSQSYIANKLRLLKLSESCRDKILKNGLSERHARALLRLDTEDETMKMIEKIVEMRLSVAASEAMIDAHVERSLPKMLECESAASGIARFEEILRKSAKSLKGLGINVDVRTTFFGRTKYITISIPE
jgi:ParB family chromosome partitioning protein